MATSTGPGTALAPSTGGAVAPLPAGGAPTPYTAPSAVVPTSAGNAVSREVDRSAGGNVALNLAAHSYLDEILKEMTLLNGELQILNDRLATLKASSSALDAIITNVDELGKLFEAPATTRSALDADSRVATAIDEMVDQAQVHGHNAQVLNAQGFLGLQTVRRVQDNERAMGAGPRLLASAGRL